MKLKACPICSHPLLYAGNGNKMCLYCGWDNHPHEKPATTFRRFVVDSNEEITSLAQKNLKKNLDGSLDYCLNRGISEQSISEWRLGYISDGFSRLKDLWHKRILFPICDITGKNVIAFGSRKIVSDDRPKYVNSWQSVEYSKKDNLYGSWRLPEFTEYVYLCEGFVDVITMDAKGYAYPVASLGTSLTTEQAALLFERAKNVVICYDSDGPGQVATSRAINLLRCAGYEYENISVMLIDGAKDVDEALHHGAKIETVSVPEYYERTNNFAKLAELWFG